MPFCRSTTIRAVFGVERGQRHGSSLSNCRRDGLGERGHWSVVDKPLEQCDGMPQASPAPCGESRAWMARNSQSCRAARPSSDHLRQASVSDRMVCRPSLGSGRAAHQARILQRGDDRAHRLRAHPLCSGQARRRRRPVLFQAQKHRDLGRRQVADIRLFAQSALQFADERARSCAKAAARLSSDRGFTPHDIACQKPHCKDKLISLTEV